MKHDPWPIESLIFDDKLPISQRREEIAECIKQHQVVILCGETGSGKTTQLPKICLMAGRGVNGIIGHTQPRRIAARSVSQRIAQEMNLEGTATVACKMRFTDQTSKETRVKVMTDGILLAETQSDRNFKQYDTLIIDEAHERSLNIDFLLGYLKKVLQYRKDLKLIITSATIEPERFAKHFDKAPVIEVSGRTYPVEMRYLATDENQDLLEKIQDAVEQASRIDRGDVLIFLSGEREIRDCAELLRKMQLLETDVLPLYARLNVKAQQTILRPGKRRRIILATNVAETSITVPGIRFVIDPGFARISRYSLSNKVQRLPIEKISQASANQRAGRCGRVQDGICFRLYSQEDFQLRPEFTDPEISRTNLASVILQMLSLKLGDIQQFPFIQPPDRRYINDGMKLLFELGAVTTQQKLTAIGRQLAKLPLDPRLARMLIAANQFGALTEVLVIATAMSIQDPRERPMAHQQAADEKHAKFKDEQSDFISFLNLWEDFQTKRHELSNNQLRKSCQKNFVSWQRMREWGEVQHQILQVCHGLKFNKNSTLASYEKIHQSLLTGLLSQVALKDEDKTYLATRNRKVWIFPGSGLFKKVPKWIMAGTLLETTKLYAHAVAKIDPNWIEPLAPHQVTRTYSEPYWNVKQQKTCAYEQVSLMGLVLVPKRSVGFASIDSEAARKVFIREALVGQKIKTRARFFTHFKKQLDTIEALESKTRRRDVLVDDDELFALFDQQIPKKINNTQQFHGWYYKASKNNPDFLCFSQQQMTCHDGSLSEAQFPNIIRVDDQIVLKVSYQFSPEQEGDGVNISVPLPVLPALNSQMFDWLVPGLIEEKVVALIKGLPKSIRTSFVPAPDYARQFLNQCQFGQGCLHEKLIEFFWQEKRLRVVPDQILQINLASHLNIYFNVTDFQQKIIAKGGDLALLQKSCQQQSTAQPKMNQTHEIEQSGLTEWNVALPEKIQRELADVKFWSYPALVDEGETVAIQLFNLQSDANKNMRLGLERLLRIKLEKELKYIKKQWQKYSQMLLTFQSLPVHPNAKESQKPNLDQAIESMLSAVIQQQVLSPLPITPDAFSTCIKKAGADIVEKCQNFAKQLDELLSLYRKTQSILNKSNSLRTMQTALDCQQQLAAMFYRGFLQETPECWLLRCKVYLLAIIKRLEKAEQNPQKDQVEQRKISVLWDCYRASLAEDKSVNEDKLVFRWQLEELRVSLFAQPIKTLMPVSVKRLEKLWKE
jgi:ATP-dependent helicase HrpA